jgi:hypothetical protein
MSDTQHTPVEYHDGDGGDVIIGSKEQIQAFGLGIGRAFPGEPGGPARGRALRLRDPLGREAHVRRLSADRFIVRVELGTLPEGSRRPARLTMRPAEELARAAQRERSAARDVAFQAALARLVRFSLADRATGP